MSVHKTPWVGAIVCLAHMSWGCQVAGEVSEITPCLPGDKDCSCNQGKCEDGLFCNDDVICEACNNSVAGCPCDAQQACSGSVLCFLNEGRCVAPESCSDKCGAYRTCDTTQGRLTCLDACEEGFQWEGDGCVSNATPIPDCLPAQADGRSGVCESQNRVCVDEGTTARCGKCVDGYIEENGLCVLNDACSTLDCAGQRRACGKGESCGACLEGFREVGGECYLINCQKDHGASLLNQCASVNRVCAADPGEPARCGECASGYVASESACVEDCTTLSCQRFFRTCDTEPTPHCAGCLDGYVEDTEAGVCVGGLGCNEESDCPDGSFCVQVSAYSQGRCEALPRCGEYAAGESGAAWDPFLQECVACGACTGTGLTGRIWPVTSRNGFCICETETNYYHDVVLTHRAALPCDADGDGWVRRPAHHYIEEEQDLALRLNARCLLRVIDTFVLENEFGQRHRVPVSSLRGLAPGTTLLELYEATANDEANAADQRQPIFGSRRPNPEEINPLTKLCVNDSADYNGNELADFMESAASPLASGRAWMEGFKQLGFFLELHRGWYERGNGDGPGVYVIQERSRCDADFPLTYSAEEGSDFWRGCMRRRAGFYQKGQAGFDFAEFSPAELVRPKAVDGEPGTPAPHGLCDLSLPLVDDPTTSDVDEGTWRGMLHHSQFRCAELVVTNAQPHELLVTDVAMGGPGLYAANRCGIGEGASTPLDPATGNPFAPAFSCTVSDVEPAAGQVVWASARYHYYADGSAYERGCINECVEFPEHCPGYAANPSRHPCPLDGKDASGQGGEFGALTCRVCDVCHDNGTTWGECDGPKTAWTDLCETDRCNRDEHCVACKNACPGTTRCFESECCEPQTCADITDCVSDVDDGCGQTLSCGCENDPDCCVAPNLCYQNACRSVAEHCENMGYGCGTYTDGDFSIDCGECGPCGECSAGHGCVSREDGLPCEDSETKRCYLGECCEPLTCDDTTVCENGIDDGCGGTIDCGCGLDPGCSPCCGDGVCNGDETCGTCADCSPCCGDGTCDAEESCGTCSDCSPCCGDGVCDVGESCGGCSDCSPCCGDGACNGEETCGTCADCSPCCGDGICNVGESCGDCSDCSPCCGDGVCNGSESCGACDDCSPCCGDGVCDPGEDCRCSDCPCSSNSTCKDGVCRKVNGESCRRSQDCASGICNREGICCNTKCDSSCRSCNGRNTKRRTGTCAPIKRGCDPYDDCPGGLGGVCLTWAACDGYGGCMCCCTTGIWPFLEPNCRCGLGGCP